ncbi:MAG TPA: hypothetical protein VLK34_04105, partial [Nocardioidaceae bacterium]|nr:hypothetical protein [Nocardioidaceae bacterium]
MTPTGRLLDEIAACERQVRALQARQLGLLAEYAAAERDGLRPGECEQTERAVAMEAATALGASTASARMLVCDADTLVGLLPAAAAATPSATPRSATSTTDSSTPPADPPHPTTPTPTASAATRQPDTQPDHGGPVPDAHRITWT